MHGLWQDLRYGLRVLFKTPSFTALAILALALGIGANTAVFSVAMAFIRKPVAFPNLDRLVMVLNLIPGEANGEAWNAVNPVAPGDYLDWKNQTQSFEHVSAWEWKDVNLTGNGDPEKLQGFLVAADFFGTLEVKPALALGRAFLPEEEQPGREDEVILSYGLWQRRFAADPGILGKTIRLDSKSHVVVGVMGKDFDFPASAQLWLPLALDESARQDRTDRALFVFGRLKAAASLGEAQAEMWTLQRRLQARFPEEEKGWGVRVMSLRLFAGGEISDQYCLLLLAAVGFVLLIACANVANLQLARSASRQKEVAVRQAMGAGKWRIVRQLLTESVLLALAGAALGVVLGQIGIDVIRRYMPAEVERFLPSWKHVRLEWDTFLYTGAIALLAGLLSGLAPAFQSSHSDLNEELKEGGRGGTSGRARQRLRGAFVVAEVALSLILLIGAGLMAKGQRALLSVNDSLEPAALLTMRMNLPKSKYKTAPHQIAFFDQALAQLDTIPGVQSAAVVTNVPFGFWEDDDSVAIEGRPAQPEEFRTADFESASPSYFLTMKIRLRRGRELALQDGADAPPVVVVSEAFVHKYFPDQDPLGKRIKRGRDDAKSPWMTIVGVVEDVKYQPWTRQEAPAVYVSYRQVPLDYSYLVLRTAGDPTQFGAAVRSRIAAVDSDQPVYDIQTLKKVISNQILGLSYVAVMLTVLGVMALVLACVGVYGVMAYSVSERTHEIGIRITVGARPRDVLRLVLGRGILLTAMGLLIGIPLSVGLARLVASLIFGVSASDLATFGSVTLLMSCIALLACYVPARRAMQVDPMVALRHE